MGVKDLFKGSAEGIIGGLTNGAANIISKIKADPTKVLEYEKELKELETNAMLKIAETANQLEIAYLVDTQNARDNNAKIQESDKASWLSKNVNPLLTISVTLGFFTLLFFMLSHNVPKENERIMDILLGTLGGAWLSIINFHFGSSKGSEEKQKHLMKITK